MTVRWGIAGSGRIARIMATEFTAAQHAELVAVGSRSAERAGQFAAEFGLPHAHGS